MSYQSQEIFEQARLNAVCDVVVSALFDQFPATGLMDPDYVYKSIILTGKAAAILQEEATGDVPNITLITNNAEMYLWLVGNLSGLLFNCKVLAFKERILFYVNDFPFEIWFSEEETLDIVLVGENVYMQDYTSIPSESIPTA